MYPEIHTLAVYAKYVAPPTKLDGCHNARTRAAANILMEKNDKTSVSSDC